MINTNKFIFLLNYIFRSDEDKDNIHFFKKCLKTKRLYSYKSLINMYYNNIHLNTKLDDIRLNRIKHMYFHTKFLLNKFNYFFRHIFIKKHVKNFDKDTDLYMIPLTNYKNNMKLTIIIDNTRYFFRTSDLINLWCKALNNHSIMFVKPLHLKNPYTNKRIKNHNLYNIYFNILDSGFNIPININKYFLYNFNIFKFKTNNFCDLKDYAINNFIKNGNIYDKYNEVNNMISYYSDELNNISLKRLLSYDIKVSIINKLNSYLHKYLIIKYSPNIMLVNKYKINNGKLLKNYINDFPNLELNQNIFNIPLPEPENIDEDSDDEFINNEADIEQGIINTSSININIPPPPPPRPTLIRSNNITTYRHLPPLNNTITNTLRNIYHDSGVVIYNNSDDRYVRTLNNLRNHIINENIMNTINNDNDSGNDNNNNNNNSNHNNNNNNNNDNVNDNNISNINIQQNNSLLNFNPFVPNRQIPRTPNSNRNNRNNRNNNNISPYRLNLF